MVLLVVTAGIGVAWVLIERGAIDATVIRNAVADHPFAPVLFVALQVLASLIFIPRTVLGIAAGMIFGFAWGAFWAMLGAELGAAAGFALWRWIGIGKFDPARHPRLNAIIAQAEKGGWRAVAIARLIPLPHSVVNTALAFAGVGWVEYLAGSLLGMLPMTLLQVDIGATGGQVLEGHAQWFLGPPLALGLAATFLLRRAASRRF
jgi:uncharacterized membrane protein YdjX (TVP38/TMEM64 family)